MIRTTLLKLIVAITFSVSVPTTVTAGSPAIEIKPLLIEGEPVPGLPGEVFIHLDRPATNNSGQSVLLAETTTGEEALWGQSVPGGDVTKLLQIGDTVPGFPDLQFATVINQVFSLSQSGIVVHEFSVEAIEGRGLNRQALVAGNANDFSISVIALEGDDAPDTNSQYGPIFGSPARDFSDSIVFTAGIQGLGENAFDIAALYVVTEPGSSPSLVALAGQASPGVEGATFKTVDVGELNGSTIAFLATLKGDGVNETNDGGAWLGAPSQGAQTLILRKGDQVPGAADGIVFSDIFQVTVFDDGRAGINAVAITPKNPFGETIDGFVHPESGSFQKLAFAGDPVPGIDDAIYLRVRTANFSLSGHALYFATIEGPSIDQTNNLGLFIATQEQTRLLARTGTDFRPGFSRGRFAQVNRRGQIAFTGSDDSFGTLLYVTLPGGTLVEVLKAGDVLDALGVPKVVSFIELGFATRGAFDAFADDGTLTFLVYFEDNTTGIFQALTLPDLLFADGFQ